MNLLAFDEEHERDDSIEYPEHITSVAALQQFVRGEMENLSTHEKGDLFANFARELIPLTELGSKFDVPVLNTKKTQDKGVDLVSHSKTEEDDDVNEFFVEGDDNESVLYIQSKVWVDEAAKIDSVISKFQAYYNEYFQSDNEEPSLFQDEVKPVYFALVTLSQLDNIVERYLHRDFASKDFFNKLRANNRIHFLDGNVILGLLQNAYAQLSGIPREVELKLENPPINLGNVYLSIISGAELKRIHAQFGDSLFFENIRSFIDKKTGTDIAARISPNDAIVETVTQAPERLLERNNGIVFRADSITSLDESGQALKLRRGSIVNGCQTTTCVIKYAADECFVPIKIVETSDAWDIAQAANFQNQINTIDLKLARFIREQVLEKQAAEVGVGLKNGSASPFRIIDELTRDRIHGEETRTLYIGFFSRVPNNIFISDYPEIRWDVLDRIQQREPSQTLETFFRLQIEGQNALAEAQQAFTNPVYSDYFQRLYKEKQYRYRCFINLLAVCGMLKENIYDRESETEHEVDDTVATLGKIRSFLDNHIDIYYRYFRLAVKVWMSSVMSEEANKAEIERDMYNKTRNSNFEGLYRNLALEADNDDWLRDEETEIRH